MDSHRRSEGPSAAQPPLPANLPALDLVGWVRRHVATPQGSRPAAPGSMVEGTPAPDVGGGDLERRVRRASAYLSRLPGAVSGQRGHDRTFRAACVLIKGFD